MITKRQRKKNNKTLAMSAGKQLNEARHEAGFLLSDVAKNHNYNVDFLDMMESGAKLYPLHEITYIAAIYNKKIIITLVDDN